jgi:hypothetical protein
MGKVDWMREKQALQTEEKEKIDLVGGGCSE